MHMLKTLCRYIGNYRRDSILTPLYTALEVLMEILIPFVTAAIIDRGIEAGSMRGILLYGAVILLFACLSLVFGVRAGTHAASASAGFACNLRDAIYENVQTFSFSNIDKFSTAGLVTRMTTDVTNMQNAYQMLLRIAVRAPLMLLCSIRLHRVDPFIRPEKIRTKKKAHGGLLTRRTLHGKAGAAFAAPAIPLFTARPAHVRQNRR